MLWVSVLAFFQVLWPSLQPYIKALESEEVPNLLMLGMERLQSPFSLAFLISAWEENLRLVELRGYSFLTSPVMILKSLFIFIKIIKWKTFMNSIFIPIIPSYIIKQRKSNFMESNNHPSFTSFGQAYIFHAVYHHNIVNKIIHIICLPMIIGCALASLTFLPFKFPLYEHEIGLQHVLGFLYFLLLSAFHPLLTIVLSAFYACTFSLWIAYLGALDSSLKLGIIVILFIVGLVFQQIGHSVFQKRRPKVNSLSGVIHTFLSPLFAMVDLLDLFGIRTASAKKWRVEIERQWKRLQREKSS